MRSVIGAFCGTDGGAAKTGEIRLNSVKRRYAMIKPVGTGKSPLCCFK